VHCTEECAQLVMRWTTETVSFRTVLQRIFLFQDVSRGLTELLAYEGNVEEDMCMSFQVSISMYLNCLLTVILVNKALHKKTVITKLCRTM